MTLLLRREALSDYSLICERASAAAERCVAATAPQSDRLRELRRCRAGVSAAEEVLTVIGDDVATATAWDVSFDDPQRDLINTRIRIALDRVSADLEASRPEIVQAADRIERLQMLLNRLKEG